MPDASRSPFTITGTGNITCYTLGASTVTSSTLMPPHPLTYASTTSVSISGNVFVAYAPPLLPEEDVAAARVDWEERQRRSEEYLARRVVAGERATQLLLAVLDAAQRASYEADRTFVVIGSHGGRYRIHRGSNGNVEALDPVTGERTARLCAHPTMRHGLLPDSDVALAQLLHLRTDEPGFCRVANVHWGRRPDVATLAA